MEHQTPPAVVLAVPGCDGLVLNVYGKVKAANLQEQMQQAYYIELDGQRVARAELLDREKAAIRSLLKAEYPEHLTF
jgi:hypothetical protein